MASTRPATAGHNCSAACLNGVCGVGSGPSSTDILSTKAHALRLFRVLPNGEARSYTATTFPRNPYQGCERFVRMCCAFGYLAGADSDSYGVLDVLNVDGDIIGDYGVPTARAFAWIKKKLGMAVVLDDE